VSDAINRIIEDMAANLLLPKSDGAVTRDTILQTVKKLAPIVTAMHNETVTADDIELITKRLEERFDITMNLGAIFAEAYRPWLAGVKGDIDWFYWNRYRRQMVESKLPPNVILTTDWVTDQILDHMENPNKQGKWSRRGMVVGHVQSGKTANYIGLVNKAADSGYRVIIVLAGTLNSLRSQTQIRVDSGFIGKDSSIPQKPYIGVGLLASDKTPAYFTTSTSDFKKSIANSIGVGIEGLKEPAILVIKKNKSTLTNLIDWLKHSTKYNLQNHPMLLIDDEADNASINTRDSGEEATAINKKIRELLRLFERSAYVGYTATPFANVFIDPDTVDEMIGEDLFPRDFIISLDPPSNYVGAARIFSSDADLEIVKIIDDFEDTVPLKHKKDLEVTELPQSCVDAVSTFILARAIRILRGQTSSHNSMLVNISRFTRVQSQVKLIIDGYVKRLREAIINYSRLSEQEALSNRQIRNLRDTWLKEYPTTEFQWATIQSVLKEAVSSVETVEVNSLASAASLDFSRRNYPAGRNVIAVGGLSLSRGLTLEGLTVSYFLRNSMMYDTLMQMGRWFGYRDNYADICRIFMSRETASWYGYISDVMEELREEFRRMQAAQMTPKDFGLAVRSHPESLIVTARNKMRTGKTITKEIDLSGKLVETSVLHSSGVLRKQNLATLEWMVEKAIEYGTQDTDVSKYYYWRCVPSEHILEFLGKYINYIASYKTEAGPLQEYVGWLDDRGLSTWDILLVSPVDSDSYSNISKTVAKLKIRAQKRQMDTSSSNAKENGVTLYKRRVGTPALERAGLSQAQIADAERRYREEHPETKTIPGYAYQNHRERPLLMLHVLDIQTKDGNPLFDDGIAAYGIVFPRVDGAVRPEKLVQYVVNTVWWKSTYDDMLEDADDDLGIDE
jgi:hypothetical protein